MRWGKYEVRKVKVKKENGGKEKEEEDYINVENLKTSMALSDDV